MQRHLNAYALVASAAGIGALALAQPAEAKIVYTPAHKVLLSCFQNGVPCFRLDLNHDGVIDFRFVLMQNSSGSTLTVRPAMGEDENQIWGTTSYWSYGGGNKGRPKALVASALNSGVSVGPNSEKFKFGTRAMWGVLGDCGPFSTECHWGQWENAQDKYLGLRFYIKGKIHYGWARLNVNGDAGISASLTGYAYETIPNKGIITGKTKGLDVITLGPGSLGALAAGASRLRR
jgi:hypothetical protein